MDTVRQVWVQRSIAQAVLLALLLVSIVPIVLISVLFINDSSEALTRQMEDNLQLIASTRAAEMNLLLTDVVNTTVIAARHASLVLGPEGDGSSTPAPEALARYQPDERNIIGLDVWYNGQGGEAALGAELSNVYWDNRVEPSAQVLRHIVRTEELDRTFASIKEVSPHTQWIYLTTPDGMMRLYPWASNDHYPDDWDPRQIIFYTVAEPGGNPELEPRWTQPYVDYAGAGWMVTLSIPVVGADGRYLGMMSHDITIDALQQQALTTTVLDGGGYGFLVASDGTVIAHPDFMDDEASKGSQEAANLLETGSEDFRGLVRQMVRGDSGMGYFSDERRGEQLLVFAPIPSIGWSLGVVVPRTEVVAPAAQMQSRAMLVTVLFVIVASVVAVFLTRLIHQPLLQLLHGVRQVKEDKRADVIRVNSFSELSSLAAAFNEMTAHVWERQDRLKREVAELRIEVDASRQKAQLESITESDYFKHLEVNAERMRAKLREASPNDRMPGEPIVAPGT